jgi:hypothetical protein
MTTNKISRRQALKTLLAAGGSIGAVSFLPAKWLKPVVESGVLPAHAQTSGAVKLPAGCVSGYTLFAYTTGGGTSLNLDLWVPAALSGKTIAWNYFNLPKLDKGIFSNPTDRSGSMAVAFDSPNYYVNTMYGDVSASPDLITSVTVLLTPEGASVCTQTFTNVTVNHY